MGSSGNLRKAKLYSSRQIRTQVTDDAFTEGSRLLIPHFLQSRKFEIESLERAQLQSKYSGAARCFQSLPRTLRRRVASHNVKRIPKRLRNRAIREMSEGTVSAMIQLWNSNRIRNLRGKQRYRLLMMKKLLLIQTKMRYMRSFPNKYRLNNPQKRLLRHTWKTLNRELRNQRQQSHSSSSMLNNRVGAYDNYGNRELAERPRGNIKYWKRQRDYVWLSTHMWHVKRFHMIKVNGWQIPLLPTQKCFKSMNRAKKHDSVLFDTSYMNHMVVSTTSSNSIFNDLIAPLARICEKDVSTTEGGIYEGLIYYRQGKSPYVRITSVMIYWKGKEAIIRTYPSAYEEFFAYIISEYPSFEIQDCRYAIGSLEFKGPKALEILNKALDVDSNSELIDLWNSISNYPDTFPPGTCLSLMMRDARTKKRTYRKNVPDLLFIELLQSVISHRPSTSLANHATRYSSYEEMKSIKQVQKETSQLVKESTTCSGKIPILLVKRQSNSWSLLMPWFWILPTWQVLVKYPLVKPGGMKQMRQFDFEAMKLSYPSDFPFTVDGWLWQNTQKTLRAVVYSKLPKSKRVEFGQYEGPLDPHGSDWEFLRRLHYQLKRLENEKRLPLSTDKDFAKFNYERDINEPQTGKEMILRQINLVHDLIQSIKSGMEVEKSFPSCSICLPGLNDQTEGDEVKAMPILPIKCVLLQLDTGLLKDSARIYRWREDPSAHDQMITDLIGFVTSGGMNLDLGKLLGLGCVIHDTDLSHGKVLVRNVGQTKYHHAVISEL